MVFLVEFRRIEMVCPNLNKENSVSKSVNNDEPIAFSYLYVMMAGFFCIFLGYHCRTDRPNGYGYHLVRYQIVSYPAAPSYYYNKQSTDKTEWGQIRSLIVEGNGLIEEDVNARITQDTKNRDESQNKMPYIVVITSMQKITKDQYTALDYSGVSKITIYRK